MTVTQKSIEASSGWTDYPDPALPEVAAPIALSGMRLDTTLDVCNLTKIRFSNCPLPRFWPDPCDPAYPTDGPDNRCSATVWDSAEFRPFTFYDLQEAPCVDPLVDLQEYANKIVSESTAWALTRVLQNGAGVTTTSLQNANSTVDADLSATAAVHPTVAISKLMKAMAERGAGRLTIHVPFWALPFLETERLVRLIGGTYRTSGGIPVNVGLGFTGVGPDQTANIDNTGDGEAYFYATRDAIRYNVSELSRYSPNESIPLIHYRTNTSMEDATRTGIVTFDAGCVYAIRACLNKASFCA